MSDKETAPWMREAATRAARVIWARRETISWGEFTFEELVEIIAVECRAPAPQPAEFAQGRLFQFRRMKKERPIDPTYWDMHEENALKELGGYSTGHTHGGKSD